MLRHPVLVGVFHFAAAVRYTIAGKMTQRIDVRANEGRERRPTDDTDDQAFSLTNLIDIFSRPARGRSGSQSQWRAESSSFLLANLNKGVR